MENVEYSNPAMENYVCDGQMCLIECQQVLSQHRHNIILKAVLLMREKLDIKSSSKEEQMRYAGMLTNKEIEIWTESLLEEINKTPEQKQKEAEERERIMLENDFMNDFMNDFFHDSVSCTAGDYSPSSPWNAPGMSIRDFI